MDIDEYYKIFILYGHEKVTRLESIWSVLQQMTSITIVRNQTEVCHSRLATTAYK